MYWQSAQILKISLCAACIDYMIRYLRSWYIFEILTECAGTFDRELSLMYRLHAQVLKVVIGVYVYWLSPDVLIVNESRYGAMWSNQNFSTAKSIGKNIDKNKLWHNQLRKACW